MPCNTIQRSKVEFLAKSTDVQLFIKGLQALGLSHVEQVGELVVFRTQLGVGNYHKATGKLILPESFDGNAIRRAYSEQVVQAQAVRHGWRVSTWTTNAQGHRQLIVQRRG